MKHIAVDPDRCVGHGRCYALAPDVYDADDVGHSTLLIEDFAGELEQHAQVGAQNCPEEAITLSS